MHETLLLNFIGINYDLVPILLFFKSKTLKYPIVALAPIKFVVVPSWTAKQRTIFSGLFFSFTRLKLNTLFKGHQSSLPLDPKFSQPIWFFFSQSLKFLKLLKT